MKISFLLSLMIFFSSAAFSECGGGSCTDVKITRMFISADGNSVIGTSGDESKLSCDAGSKGYITLDKDTSENYNAVYALLLAAHTTEHPMRIRTNESENDACKIIYVVSDK
ncbi:MAG: hypothetical protein RPS47_05645 [Colwellia sp.]